MTETLKIIAQGLKKISEHCENQGGCQGCKFNEVSASRTARFCLFRTLPSNWPASGLFQHVMEQAKKEPDI